MSHAAVPLALEKGQRELLESVARSRTSAHRLVLRARVLLSAADGVSNSEIASGVGVSRPTVLAWRAEFAQRGLWRFGQVAPGRGRRPSIPQETVDRRPSPAAAFVPSHSALTASS